MASHVAHWPFASILYPWEHVHIADPGAAYEFATHGCGAETPATQKWLAGHWMPIPPTQYVPSLHVAWVPLMHTLFAGHGSHPQPPKGRAASVTRTSPAMQSHADPFQAVCGGHPHCARDEAPAGEYVLGGHEAFWSLRQ